MIHLDTSFLIQALIPGSQSEGRLQRWLSSGETLAISAIAWSEFLCGPLTLEDEGLAQTLVAPPEPFLSSDAHTAARLFNLTGRRSRSLADCQIAAVAIRCGARVATGNPNDFTLFQSHGLALA